LQCVAVCCSALQCVAVCCSVLTYVGVCCSILQCVAAHDAFICGKLKGVTGCGNLNCVFIRNELLLIEDQCMLQCIAVCCSVFQGVTAWRQPEVCAHMQ